MKKSSYIQYHWWMYLVLVIVVVLLWSYIFGLIAQPKAYQKYAIAIFDKNFLHQQLQDELSQQMPNITTQQIKQVTVESLYDLGSSLQDMVLSRTILSDVIVVPLSMITTDNQQTDKIHVDNFFAIPTEKLELLVDFPLDYYMVEGYARGIYINNPDDGVTNNFERFYTGTERCVMFLCEESANIGDIFDDGNGKYRVAIEVLAYLLEESDGKTV